MASYQARQRDPLFDSDTQAMIERRGKELIGFGLIVLAILVGMILWSYSPDDPSWLSVTDAPAHNLLGRFGASLASPMIVIAGLGAWGICAVLAVWGVRFMAHLGEERAISRTLFAPIAVALASVYASTLVPPATWGHSFGLGGLFGDTVLGAVLGVVPVKAAFGLKILSLVFALAMLAMGAFVLGMTNEELKRFARFMLFGVIMLYAGLMRLLGLGASGTAQGTRRLIKSSLQRRAERRAERKSRVAAVRETPGAHLQEPAVHRAQPVVRRAETPASEAPLRAEVVRKDKPGLLGRLPGFRKATTAQEAPRSEMPEPELFGAQDMENPDIRSKIAEIVQNRAQRQQELAQEAAAHGQDMQRPVILKRDGNHMDPAAGQLPLAPESAPAMQPQEKPVVQHPPRKALRPSRQARKEEQPSLQFEEKAGVKYEIPPLGLLGMPSAEGGYQLSDEALEENARMLENVLDDYGVKGEIVSVRPGPVVTMYELEPAPGLKASRVIGLSDDIARSMSALSARVSTVPGRSVIGIELPNERREMVMLREILSSHDFGDSNMRLPLALGKDIGGDPIVASLAKMPHLLIAGTTGSGKSVAINTMILSLLYKLTPDECRLIMIDPKMLELSVYDGIPHLLSPVVTDPKKAVVALKWVVAEMEERYRKMSKMGVRNIEGYNGRVQDALDKNEMFSRTVQTGFDDETGEPVFETEEIQPEKLPYIVVIVDEMADLMMVAGKEIEACIQRLAQMARASGIHLIMATQRPSVDVITGTIKANFPTRISFQVTSKVDSRTILGEQGAEQLLGMGDMLYMAGGAKITRVHGPFVSDEEVEEVVNHLKAFGPPDYVGGVVEGPDAEKESELDQVLGLGGNTGAEDALYDQAVAIVARDRKCSTSYIQRKLAIGYNKAARLVEQMEDAGLVSAANHVGKREILIPEPQ